MKSILLTICAACVVSSLNAQNLRTIDGDWMRVHAEFHDGSKLPYNHNGRVIQRYYFQKGNVFLVNGTMANSIDYSQSGNRLNIGPIQKMTIEKSTDRELVLVEDADLPIRYFLIPTDSFTVSYGIKKTYEVVNADTIYNSTIGIEPIYIGDGNRLSTTIMRNLDYNLNFGAQYTYVIQKDGSIGEVVILSSTDEKRNKRLIQLIKKSSGKWIPGAIGGKPVHVKIKDTISLKKTNSYSGVR